MGVIDLTAFRNDVGESDPVCVRGGGTRWEVGGDDAGVRSVTAPSGIEAFEPAEMTVTVGAGTTVATLSAALAEDGQEVAIDGPHGSTVGGARMIGRSSLRRGRLGELTDVLLQADCVGADGALFTAGGPTVKNVTGYDLCRLLVGSLGTLALVGRVILRTRPLPEAFAWMSGAVSTGGVVDVLSRPGTEPPPLADAARCGHQGRLRALGRPPPTPGRGIGHPHLLRRCPRLLRLAWRWRCGVR